MYYINVDFCVQCGACVDACTVKAISSNGGIYSIGDSCIGCGDCVAICPSDAIQVYDISVWEFIEVVHQAVVFVVPVAVVGETRNLGGEENNIKIKIESSAIDDEFATKMENIGLNSYRQAALVKYFLKRSMKKNPTVLIKKDFLNEENSFEMVYKGIKFKMTYQGGGYEYRIIKLEVLK